MGVRLLPNATEAVESGVRCYQLSASRAVLAELRFDDVAEAVHYVHTGEEPAGSVDFLGSGNARRGSRVVVGKGCLAAIGIIGFGEAAEAVIVLVNGGLTVLVRGAAQLAVVIAITDALRVTKRVSDSC